MNMPDLLRTVASPVVLEPLDFRGTNLVTQLLDQIVQTNDRANGNNAAEVPLGHADGALRLRIADPLLAVQQDHDTGDDAALLLDDTNSLPQSSASSDDIVDDHDALALQRGTDNISTLAVGLGLLAVEGVAHVVPSALRRARERVTDGELVCDGGADGNSLVGGAEDDIEVGLGGAVGGGSHEGLSREDAGVSGRSGAQKRRSVQEGGGEEVG
ncbi:hypothetical protein F1880_004848 [Penicillium rolfsii]|nr:hypothetical protein F1880_004848 [Penicillium rolfsii]